MSKIGSYSELKRNEAYALEQEKELKDISALGIVLRHKKTGARLCIISSDDENKVFGIGFRTTPTDSTGVPHIIEHSVLCGSERYPVKDPFMELEKSSVNTFLNAITFPDKTVYPVASCNDKDFSNLVHVYVDAVFNPSIYKKKEFFLQEGWRYVLENKEDELTLNGIVYSEMKGVYSDPESVLRSKIQEAFFPDNTYGFESGGAPEVIPELTYEDYLAFHSKYYHPTNSYIFLYGNMDIEAYLEYLDKEYLCYYDYAPVDSEVKPQKMLGSYRKDYFYASSENEKPETDTFICKNYYTGKSDEVEKQVAIGILSSVLFIMPGAPVKQALLDAGLGEDVMCSAETEILQTFLTVGVKNSDLNRAAEFEQVLNDALREAINKGIDKNSLRAILCATEFEYREGDFGRYPKGIFYMLHSLSTWLYDDNNPFAVLERGYVFSSIAEKIDTDYFEKLTEEIFFASEHNCLVTLAPDAQLNEKNEKALKDKLAAIKASMTEEELDALVAQTKNLKEFQETPDSPEAIATVPKLSIEDISRKARPFSYNVSEILGAKYVTSNYSTNDIVYFKVSFAVDDVAEKDIPALGLLANIVGKMNAGKYGYLELSNEINIATGGISTDVTPVTIYRGDDNFLLFFSCGGKVLYKNVRRACELFELLMCETDFTDKKRLKELILETKSRIASYMSYAGNSVASRRANSYLYNSDFFADNSDGYAYYKYICNIADNFDELADSVIADLQRLYKYAVVRNRAFVSATASEEGTELFKKEITSVLEKLPEGTASEERKPYSLGIKREGLSTAGQVQYAAKTVDFRKPGFEWDGTMQVVRTILNLDYLWNEIRVKGGAYGCGVGIGRDDRRMTFSSYRDPNLKETLETFDGAGKYLRELDITPETLNSYIISTTGGMDSPLTPAMLGARSVNAYLSGVTLEDIQKERDELLSTTVEMVRSKAKFFDLAAASNAICVIGYEGKLRENEELFGEIKPLV